MPKITATRLAPLVRELLTSELDIAQDAVSQPTANEHDRMVVHKLLECMNTWNDAFNNRAGMPNLPLTIELLTQMAKDYGPCDHTVNICACGLRYTLEDVQRLASARKCANCGEGLLHTEVGAHCQICLDDLVEKAAEAHWRVRNPN